MEVSIVIIAALIYAIYKKDKKINLLRFENHNLKIVMAQEGLIPKEFVK